jgi:hypothetical protein
VLCPFNAFVGNFTVDGAARIPTKNNKQNQHSVSRHRHPRKYLHWICPTARATDSEVPGPQSGRRQTNPRVSVSKSDVNLEHQPGRKPPRLLVHKQTVSHECRLPGRSEGHRATTAVDCNILVLINRPSGEGTAVIKDALPRRPFSRARKGWFVSLEDLRAPSGHRIESCRARQSLSSSLFAVKSGLDHPGFCEDSVARSDCPSSPARDCTRYP